MRLHRIIGFAMVLLLCALQARPRTAANEAAEAYPHAIHEREAT